MSTTMADLMRILKPVKTCHSMDMCSNYLKEIQEAERDGETNYEIRGLNTKSGNPHVIEFYNNQ